MHCGVRFHVSCQHSSEAAKRASSWLQGFKCSFHHRFWSTFKARRECKSGFKVYLVKGLISQGRSKNETLSILWNGRIGLYGSAYENLQLIWVSNLSGPYTATLLSPWKGYRVCQLGFWKAFYLSLNQMQSRLLIPLSWEWIMILLGMAFEEKVKKHTMELAHMNSIQELFFWLGGLRWYSLCT